MTTDKQLHPDAHEPLQPLRLPSSGFLSDDALYEEFQKLLQEDPGVAREALVAAEEMRNTPIDEKDRVARPSAMGAEGKVGRRAPPNPIASPWLGKYRRMQGEAKVADPALRNNPLRGRLLVTFNTTFILIFVFFQSLMANYIKTGKALVPKSVNSMYGPSPEVLDDLGGLNTNLIRQGQTARIFWSMWMHSGFLHILLNVISQFQFLYMYEPDWGFWRVLLVYWVAGVSGNLMSAIIDPCSVTVGSSGALYGLMGAMLPYCIEYWKTIPRPWCILIFTFIVVCISILTGFTSNTDNWAHLGGIMGGTLFAFGTLQSLVACEDCCEEGCVCWKKKGREDNVALVGEGVVVGPDGRRKKKVVKRGKIARVKGLKPECKCGLREWVTRILGWCGLFALWFTCFWLLYEDYEFQPSGHITFSGKSGCCCCYRRQPEIRANWECYLCEATLDGRPWGEFCGLTTNNARRLRQIEGVLYDKLHLTSSDGEAEYDRLLNVTRRMLSAHYVDADGFEPDWFRNDRRQSSIPHIMADGDQRRLRFLQESTERKDIDNDDEDFMNYDYEELLGLWIGVRREGMQLFTNPFDDVLNEGSLLLYLQPLRNSPLFSERKDPSVVIRM